jgi:hypothetical protein
VTSLPVGIARSEGMFPPLQSFVVDSFPECADLRTPENARITYQHLLTMSHGLLWDENKPWDDPANNERQMLEAKDPYRYVLEQPTTLLHRSGRQAWANNGRNCLQKRGP